MKKIEEILTNAEATSTDALPDPLPLMLKCTDALRTGPVAAPPHVVSGVSRLNKQRLQEATRRRDSALQDLLDLLGDSSRAIRISAARTIASTGSPEGMLALRMTLDNCTDDHERAMLMELLGTADISLEDHSG